MITCTECRRPVTSEQLRVTIRLPERRSYSLRTECCDALLMVGPIADLDPLYARTLTDSPALPPEAVQATGGPRH